MSPLALVDGSPQLAPAQAMYCAWFVAASGGHQWPWLPDGINSAWGDLEVWKGLADR